MPNIKSSFCCPPNVVRMIAEAHNYLYSLSPDTLWVHLYGANTLDTAWTDGSRIKLKQETDYPWAGTVKFTITEAPARPVSIKLRIPGWMHPGDTAVRVNGQIASGTAEPGGYFHLQRTWKPGDVLELALTFKPVLLEANPLVEETNNQVAVKYGPLVYCLEGDDLPAGVKLSDVALSLRGKPPTFTFQRETIAGASVLTLTTTALDLHRKDWTADSLYRETSVTEPRIISVKFVPYYAWGNRGDTDMSVWLPAR
jgi:DUF1680 family protein